MFQQDITLGPGSGTFTEHTLEILIMLTGAFLIGLWLGWLLWSRFKRESERLALENSSLTAGMDALRTELNTAKTAIGTLETDNMNYVAQTTSLNRNNANLRDRISELEAELSALSDRNRQVETELGLAQEAGHGQTLELEINDGNPGAENAVEDAVLTPFSNTPLEIIENEKHAEIIEPEEPESSETLELVTPSAVLSGITPTAEPESEKTPQTSDEPTVVVPPLVSEKDDLTVVEGIGPKIQMLLNQYGIHTYRQLATTDVARLKEILQAAGPQLAMHDPGTWPSQANLAANDEWESLKSIQGFLKGGKKPT